MPNWCSNILNIRGSEHGELTEVWREGRPFQQLVPAPTTWTKEEIEMLKESLGPIALLEQVTEQDAWYWWRLEHWGTKWDLTRDDIEVSESEGEDGVETRIRFSTAWSPPIPVIAAASRLYPHLTLTLIYCECSMEFAGDATFVGGSERESNHYEGGPEYRRIVADFGWEADEEEGNDSLIPSENEPPVDWAKEGF